MAWLGRELKAYQSLSCAGGPRPERRPGPEQEQDAESCMLQSSL